MSSVPVSFTRLETDYLPAREKREKEIREYKRKNRLSSNAGRKAGLDTNASDVGPDEDEGIGLADAQPLFLKDKGDELYRRGEVFGAINAYTTALQIDPDFLPAAMNRCLCNLEAGRLQDCEAEAGEILGKLRRKLEKRAEELDEAELEGCRKQVGKLTIRRAVARARTGQLDLAEKDLDEAAKYLPDAPDLAAAKRELERARLPAELGALQAAAAARFKDKDFPGALAAYCTILSLYHGSLLPASKAHVGATTCLIRQERFHDAAQQCRDGFRHLASLLPQGAGPHAKMETISDAEREAPPPRAGDYTMAGGHVCSAPGSQSEATIGTRVASDCERGGDGRGAGMQQEYGLDVGSTVSEHQTIASKAASSPRRQADSNGLPHFALGAKLGGDGRSDDAGNVEARNADGAAGGVDEALVGCHSHESLFSAVTSGETGARGVATTRPWVSSTIAATPSKPLEPPAPNGNNLPSSSPEQLLHNYEVSADVSYVLQAVLGYLAPYCGSEAARGEKNPCVAEDDGGGTLGDGGREIGEEVEWTEGNSAHGTKGCWEKRNGWIKYKQEPNSAGIRCANIVCGIRANASGRARFPVDKRPCNLQVVEVVGKLLVCSGMAQAHLREYKQAMGSYQAAAYVYNIVGKRGTAARLQRDAAVVRQHVAALPSGNL